MNLFHGYPLDDDQHPTWPWWRREYQRCDGGRILYWERLDGKIGHDEEEVVHIDTEAPLPPPQLLPGQVRLHPKGHSVLVSLSVEYSDDGTITETWNAARSWPLLSGPAVWTRPDGTHFGGKDCQWEAMT